ncbi:MAG: methoxyneurosporene dehydrogenase [Roseovarius sp.]|nr:methoxyneurosporene dehydrogenase [Roseovarius sp.]
MTAGTPDQTVIIGAGVAGLAAAARLAHAGHAVTLLERHDHVGGKMRALPSPAGPVAAGPTVLTLRGVFDALFADCGERLEDHIRLVRQPLLARHFWPDGSRLDLFDDSRRNAQAIAEFAGARAADQFRAFDTRARALFDGFDAPMMRAPEPRLMRLVAHVAARPHLLRQMAPLRSLADLLRDSFDDPRLAQLFGRYATYVGGTPEGVPALLALIWRAEAAGVWAVEGGMHRLAAALADLARRKGAVIETRAHVAQIEAPGGAVRAVILADGRRIPCARVLFNGDPRALATGALGPDCARVAAVTLHTPRSLSAEVWAFAARAEGPDLAHHNVFFRADPAPEFAALMRGKTMPDPTLYVCAMDRGMGAVPPDPERFEIIANAPARPDHALPEETDQCHPRCFETLARFGLTFSPEPTRAALTTPAGFADLFPASKGALYGQSPHGALAALRRPKARTGIRGLYLAGGGTHPGAGVPMAALSGRHVAEAIMRDRISTSTCRPTAMPGGISTGSARTVPARSRS